MRRSTFEALYEAHAERLYAFLTYRTGDWAASEDLLSDVFERALRSRRRFDPRKGSETAWLYTIALNLVRDRFRRLETERRTLERLQSDNPPSVADRTGDVAEQDAVMRAIAQLSPEEREVIALRFGADLTAPQIARVLKLPLTTVEGRLYRAMRKLSPQLDPVRD